MTNAETFAEGERAFELDRQCPYPDGAAYRDWWLGWCAAAERFLERAFERAAEL